MYMYTCKKRSYLYTFAMRALCEGRENNPTHKETFKTFVSELKRRKILNGRGPHLIVNVLLQRLSSRRKIVMDTMFVLISSPSPAECRRVNFIVCCTLSLYTLCWNKMLILRSFKARKGILLLNFTLGSFKTLPNVGVRRTGWGFSCGWIASTFSWLDFLSLVNLIFIAPDVYWFHARTARIFLQRSNSFWCLTRNFMIHVQKHLFFRNLENCLRDDSICRLRAATHILIDWNATDTTYLLSWITFKNNFQPFKARRFSETASFIRTFT